MRILAACAVVFFFVVWAPAPPLRAAPVPPKLVVNHETKQCAQIFGGDECMTCNAPEGWETLGYAGEVECPAGYAQIDDLELECRPFKTQFCCTEGHSGAHGDCEGLVIDHGRKLCAFVEDIHSAAPPGGWSRRPEGLASDRWYCPNDYDWAESPDQAADDKGRSRSVGLPCLGAVLLGPTALAVFLSSERPR